MNYLNYIYSYLTTSESSSKNTEDTKVTNEWSSLSDQSIGSDWLIRFGFY